MNASIKILAGMAILIAAAAPAYAAADNTTLNVLVVRATKSNSDVSPELKGIASQLKKQFTYTGYKVVGKHNASVALNKTHKISMPGGYEATFTPQQREKTRIRVKVEVTKQEKGKRVPALKTTLGLTPGKTALVGGWKITGSSDVIILAVSAK